MSDVHYYADWVNELAGDYVEDWVGRQISEELVHRDHKIDLLEGVLRKMRPLVQEILAVHADPDCAEYNECDTDPCMWCEQVKALLEGQK